VFIISHKKSGANKAGVIASSSRIFDKKNVQVFGEN
jgi:hypothetical protein